MVAMASSGNFFLLGMACATIVQKLHWDERGSVSCPYPQTWQIWKLQFDSILHQEIFHHGHTCTVNGDHLIFGWLPSQLQDSVLPLPNTLFGRQLIPYLQPFNILAEKFPLLFAQAPS